MLGLVALVVSVAGCSSGPSGVEASVVTRSLDGPTALAPSTTRPAAGASAPTAAAPGTTVLGGRSSPVPVGATGAVGDGWAMSVDGFVPDADLAVAAANSFNDPPGPGKRYVLVKVTLRYGSGGVADRATPVLVRIEAVGPSKTSYRSSDAAVVAPDDLDISTEVFKGGALTGNIAFAVSATDAADLLVSASAGFDGAERFFATNAGQASPSGDVVGTTTTVAVGAATGRVAVPGARANPLPRRTPGAIGDGWRLTVTDYVADAGAVIAATNSFNEPPPAGKQYAMVRVTLTYGEGGTDDKANPLVIIRAVGPSNTAVNWTDSFVVAPDALVTTDAVRRGQSITGNIVFAVTSADAARLVVYASAGFGSDDVFFATAPR